MSDRRTVEERFWARVDTSSDATACWLWTGGRDKDGYGKFKVGGKDARAHVYALERIVGKLPKGILACHRCDNPPCCNDAHLFPGDHSANIRDMVSKGRAMHKSGEKHGMAKFTWEQIRDIRSRVGESQQSIATEFGTSQGMISLIRAGKIWRG